MCDAMFIYAIERAEAMGNVPVIPEWSQEDAGDNATMDEQSDSDADADADAADEIEHEAEAMIRRAA